VAAVLPQANENIKLNLRMFLLDLIEAGIPNLEKSILSKPELGGIFTPEQVNHYMSRVKTPTRDLKPCWQGQPDSISSMNYNLRIISWI